MPGGASGARVEPATAPQPHAGDRWIEDAASGADGPGNAVTHLRAATSRHLHLVLQRLATLHVP